MSYHFIDKKDPRIDVMFQYIFRSIPVHFPAAY